MFSLRGLGAGRRVNRLRDVRLAPFFVCRELSDFIESCGRSEVSVYNNGILTGIFAWMVAGGRDKGNIRCVSWNKKAGESMGAPYKSVYVQPTLKGTFFFSQGDGGSSESLYAAPPIAGGGFTLNAGNLAGQAPADYLSMQNAMLAVAPSRLALSQTKRAKLVPTNPLQLIALRVDNEQQARATVLANVQLPQGPTFCDLDPPAALMLQPGTSKVFFENDDEDSAYHCQLSDGNGHTAGIYLHGVPLSSQFNQAGAFVNEPNVPSSAFTRDISSVNSAWVQNLRLFCNSMITNGLGFRYAYTTWTIAGLPSGLYPSLGNGSAPQAYYGLPGTPANSYSFLMAGFALPVPPATAGTSYSQWLKGVGAAAPTPSTPIIGKFICIVRGQKQLRVLNGRWPAVGQFLPAGVAPFSNPAGYYVTIQRRAPNYLSGVLGSYDAAGYLAPLAWSVTQPLPGGNPMVPTPAQAPGIQLLELTEKKVGRPFGSPRGRARNRVT